MKDPKFIVDSMLGNISKKLRILGFFAEFLLDADDDILLKKSIDDNKILITRDKELYKKSLRNGVEGLLLPSDNELENLIFILNNCNIKYINSVPNTRTRCTVCNGTLLVLNKSLLSNSIPEKIYNNASIFLKCSECLKVYWDGTHTKRINMLVENINKILNNIN